MTPKLLTTALVLAVAAPLLAQQAPPNAARPFAITDNSFLVEEAFNQEAGVFQNILLVQRPGAREWGFEFTQEWPLGGQRHQLSYTIPLEAIKPVPDEGYQVTRGTIAVNYRYQLTTEAHGGAATSPRLSLLLPRKSGGDNHFGVQFNFPLSKQVADFYLHANAGFTVDGIDSDAGSNARVHTAASVIYRWRPLIHLMLESVYRADEHETLTGRADGWLVSPGIRAGVNLGTAQLVLGVAVPVGLLNDYDTQDFIAYLSYELPFMKR